MEEVIDNLKKEIVKNQKEVIKNQKDIKHLLYAIIFLITVYLLFF